MDFREKPCKLQDRWYQSNPNHHLGKGTIRATSPSPRLERSWVIPLSHHALVSAWLTVVPGAGRRMAVASPELCPVWLTPPHKPSPK